MVVFAEHAAHGAHGTVAVNGVELLYYRQFQAAVLQLTGELFTHRETEEAADPQRSWLDLLATQLPAVDIPRLVPLSHFDEAKGRQFRFHPDLTDFPWAAVDAIHLLEYQDFQAVVAHQTGSLYRNGRVESVEDDRSRQAAWSAAVRSLIVAIAPD